MNKFYTNTTFEGYWPVGAAAVVRAESLEKATSLLNEKLNTMGLEGDVQEWQMVCISDATEDGVMILCDGNY